LQHHVALRLVKGIVVRPVQDVVSRCHYRFAVEGVELTVGFGHDGDVAVARGALERVAVQRGIFAPLVFDRKVDFAQVDQPKQAKCDGSRHERDVKHAADPSLPSKRRGAVGSHEGEQRANKKASSSDTAFDVAIDTCAIGLQVDVGKDVVGFE